MKPNHVKPALYAFFYEILKDVATEFGYNLLLHGSMNRDLDLVAIPWTENATTPEPMVERFAELLGGYIHLQHNGENLAQFTTTHHGRMWFIIDVNRRFILGKKERNEDPQYYLDISVMPRIQ